MAEDEKPKNWWQTLPGAITAVAGLITAVGGLLAAMNQAGWFQSKTANAPSAAAAQPKAPAPAVVAPVEAAPPQSPAPAPAPIAAAARKVNLPAQRDYTLQGPGGFQKTTFTLLTAEIAPQTSESAVLRIRIRAYNQDRFGMNFWDRGFRLLIDGMPAEPSNSLNELVSGNSAKEGVVEFNLPNNTRSAKLKLLHLEQTTEIALDLAK